MVAVVGKSLLGSRCDSIARRAARITGVIMATSALVNRMSRRSDGAHAAVIAAPRPIGVKERVSAEMPRFPGEIPAVCSVTKLIIRQRTTAVSRKYPMNTIRMFAFVAAALITAFLFRVIA
jgi:hypothetical protein